MASSILELIPPADKAPGPAGFEAGFFAFEAPPPFGLDGCDASSWANKRAFSALRAACCAFFSASSSFLPLPLAPCDHFFDSAASAASACCAFLLASFSAFLALPPSFLALPPFGLQYILNKYNFSKMRYTYAIICLWSFA